MVSITNGPTAPAAANVVRPFQQGGLDRWSGPYAAINGFRYAARATDLARVDWLSLRAETAGWLARWPLSTERDQVAAVTMMLHRLRDALEDRYDLRFRVAAATDLGVTGDAAGAG